MRALLTLTLVLLPLGLVAGAGCTPSTSAPEWAWCWGEHHCRYVDIDVCQPECLYSIWYYEESNEIPGLQRSDWVVDDTCGGMIEGDTYRYLK